MTIDSLSVPESVRELLGKCGVSTFPRTDCTCKGCKAGLALNAYVRELRAQLADAAPRPLWEDE